jgi:hypothetical protein
MNIAQGIPIERLRIFSFNGVEIEDKDELSMIENDSYLFVTTGKKLKILFF